MSQCEVETQANPMDQCEVKTQDLEIEAQASPDQCEVKTQDLEIEAQASPDQCEVEIQATLVDTGAETVDTEMTEDIAQCCITTNTQASIGYFNINYVNLLII